MMKVDERSGSLINLKGSSILKTSSFIHNIDSYSKIKIELEIVKIRANQSVSNKQANKQTKTLKTTLEEVKIYT
jgi:predicted flavoprotein YhiN